MGLPVLMLDRKGVQAGTQASNNKTMNHPVEQSPQHPLREGVLCLDVTKQCNDMPETLRQNKSAACDGYADKTP